MKENYIYDALVQFLYHELPAHEAVEMAQLIEDVPDLRAEYDILRTARMQLPKAQFEPSQAVLNNILQYSTKTAMEAQL